MKSRGFSLIELLIVVAIILIISAIAVPNLIRARAAANESAAAGTVRTLTTAEMAYSTIYPSQLFARDLATLGPGSTGACVGNGSATNACLIDSTLGKSTCTGTSWCAKDGFNYNIQSSSSNAPYVNYWISASPTGVNIGGKNYCAVMDATIRFDPAGGILTAPYTMTACGALKPL